MNIHEYQGKAVLMKFRRPGAAGFRDPFTAGGGGGRRRQARRHGMGGKEPDPCRRARQGQVQGSAAPARRAACASRSSREEVGPFAQQMLNHTLVTLQTGPAGRVVKRIYIEEGTKIAKEFYLLGAGRS